MISGSSMAAALHISCKLTNSLLLYLDRHGVSSAELIESFGGPEEFLRDPHFWLPAEQVESLFLKAGRLAGDSEIAYRVGSLTPELQSWGALDTVFRMMPSIDAYYAALKKFFSYFLSPSDSVDRFHEIERGHGFVRFSMPLDRQDFPHVFDFLHSCLESLPRYTGHSPVQTEWSDVSGVMFVSWESAQPSLFGNDAEPGRLLSPRMMKSLSGWLEDNERLLETKNRRILELTQEMAELQRTKRLQRLGDQAAHEILNPLSVISANMGHLKKYLEHLTRYLKHAESLIPPDGLASWQRLKSENEIDFLLAEMVHIIDECERGLIRSEESVRSLKEGDHHEDQTSAWPRNFGLSGQSHR